MRKEGSLLENHWNEIRPTPEWVANQLIHGFLEKSELTCMNDSDFRSEVGRRLAEVGYQLLTYHDCAWWGAINSQDTIEKLLTRKGIDVRVRAFIALLWKELVWPKMLRTADKKADQPYITEAGFRQKYFNVVGYICKTKHSYNMVMRFLREYKFLRTGQRRKLGIKTFPVWEAGPALELWIDRNAMQVAMDQTYILHNQGSENNA